jgi:leader peptidase (prepilin peptidase)/N-methyltransferase
MEAFRLVFAALLGGVVGSFLNVVVWRLPRGESLVTPRSHCPRCGKGIAWFDNIPVLSWILLRAHCRNCRLPIPVRYPLVEALTAGAFVLATLRFVPADGLVSGTGLFASAVLAALVAVSFIDLDHRIIPDRITLPGILACVLLAPLLPALHPPGWPPGANPGLAALIHALLGAGAGYLAIRAIRLLGRLAFRKEAMGLGDAKLLALIGGAVGPIYALYALFLACFGGAILGGIAYFYGRRRPLVVAGVLEGKGFRREFDRVRIRDGALLLVADGAPPDMTLRVRLTLPAAKVLEDEDVVLAATVRATADGSTSGTPGVWRLSPEGLSEEDRARLELFSQSNRYVPFGPYLSLGGAAALLYGDRLHWVLTVWYPSKVGALGPTEGFFLP